MLSRIKGIRIGKVKIGKRAPFIDALDTMAEIKVETIESPNIEMNIIDKNKQRFFIKNSIKIQKRGVIIIEIPKIKIKLNKNFPRKIDKGSEDIFNVISVFCSTSLTNTLESPIEDEKNKESIKRAEKTSLFEFSSIL